jgi:competence protein ComEA
MNGTGAKRERNSARTAICLVALALAVAVGAALAAEADDAGTADGAAVLRIDINKASAVELTAIPGVGNALAQRIVAFREKEGPFRRVEDLLKIKGIGEKSFQKMRPHVKVEKAD